MAAGGAMGVYMFSIQFIGEPPRDPQAYLKQLQILVDAAHLAEQHYTLDELEDYARHKKTRPD